MKATDLCVRGNTCVRTGETLVLARWFPIANILRVPPSRTAKSERNTESGTEFASFTDELTFHRVGTPQLEPNQLDPY